jgi:hypothetical protein
MLALNAVSQSPFIQDVIQAVLLDPKSTASVFVSLLKHSGLKAASYVRANTVDEVVDSSCSYNGSTVHRNNRN